MKTLRVAAYCRVSTDREEQQGSMQSQRRFFEELIGRTPGWQPAGVFCDEGASGTSLRRRPALLALLAEAEAGRVDLIVTKEVSRFARNTVDALQITRRLAGQGVGVYFLNDGINTLEGDGELRLTLMATLAQEESRKTSQRVKWGQRRRMEAGVVFGSVPLGYRLENGRLAVEPGEAGVVLEIFRRYVFDGQGARVIAAALEREGVPTKRGGRWSAQTVLRVLKNEKYAGDLLQKKTVTTDYLTHRRQPNRGQEETVLLTGHHPPLIERALFERAQAELARRSAQPGQGERHSGARWCSGRLVCGLCGAPLVLRSKKRPGGQRYFGWRCRRALAGQCAAPGVGERALCAGAWAVLRAAAGDAQTLYQQVCRRVGREAAPGPSAASAGGQKRRAVGRLLEGVLPADELERLLDRLSEGQEAASPPSPDESPWQSRAEQLCALREGEAILEEAVRCIRAEPGRLWVLPVGWKDPWRVDYREGRGATEVLGVAPPEG